MKAFIINFNRLTWPKRLAGQLSATGCEVIFVDNNSTYLPLLEWYKSAPYKVYMIKHNCRAFDFWENGILEQYKDRYYIVTDCDLDIGEVPKDYIKVLLDELKKQMLIKSDYL